MQGGPLAVVTAVGPESRAVARALGLVRDGTGEMVMYRGWQGAMVLGQVGVGEQAGPAARRFLALVHPRLVVVLGVAGALRPGLRTGELIIAEAVARMGDDRAARSVEVALRTWARKAAADAGMSWSEGLLLTAPAVVGTREEKMALGREGALAVDMESWHIAEAAAAMGRPCLIVRAIADELDEALRLPPDTFVGPRGGVRVGRALGFLLCHPHRLPGLVRLGRQVGRAGRVLGAFGASFAASVVHHHVSSSGDFA